jgi:hypothetical protein
LHLAEVEVYGRFSGELIAATDASEVRANSTPETAVPQRLNSSEWIELVETARPGRN